jgi:hypothetical protein
MRAGPVAAATPGVQGDGDSYVRLFSIPRKEEEEFNTAQRGRGRKFHGSLDPRRE